MSDLTDRVLILGGYGTFGSRMAERLCAKNIHVIINGRNLNKANALKNTILSQQTNAQVSVACFDVKSELKAQLKQLAPKIVIHTCGPFQGQDTNIAKIIISAGCHYIDLADGRDYVQQMLKLGQLAEHHNVTAITAASTVPALSSAVLTHLKGQFDIDGFEQVNIGISPGQRTDRGLATTQAVLSYVGKALQPWSGSRSKRFGWQNTYLQKYPNIKSRMMGNCEAPDLDLFSDFYDIKTLTFSAGMESKLLHVSIWLASWLVRLGLPVKLANHAAVLLKISRWFDPLGSTDGGMHVTITGSTSARRQANKTWYIEAFDNHGPQIPAIPAVIISEKILSQKIGCGVQPCVDIITLDEYLSALNPEKIQTTVL